MLLLIGTKSVVVGFVRDVAVAFVALSRVVSAGNTVGTVDTVRSIMHYRPKPPTVAATTAKLQPVGCLQAVIKQHAVSFTVERLQAGTIPPSYCPRRTNLLLGSSIAGQVHPRCSYQGQQ